MTAVAEPMQGRAFLRPATAAEELSCPPLFGTQRSPERPTLGGQVAAIAQRLGKPLMPHQRYIVDVALEIDPGTGLLAYDEVVVIGPRQATGKTELLLPLMTHRCVGFDEALVRWIEAELGVTPPMPPAEGQRVLYTAQTADDARKKWRDVHVARLGKSAYRHQFNARLRLNQEAMVWRNGSMWSPASTTGKTGGTGDSVDLPVIDEAWSRPDNRTELGLRPAKMTRDWAQMWLMSMIPGLSRALPGTWKYLQHKRQVGRARVEADARYGMAFFDWAAAPGMDPGDPNTWYSCMPGLGRTVREAAVRSDFEAMDPIDFGAEYLGVAADSIPEPRWTVVSRDTWADRHDPYSELAAGDRPALALEVDEDMQRAWIGLAGRRADAHWHVAIAEPGWKVAAAPSGIGWTEKRLPDLVKETGACTVVIDPRRPAAALIPALKRLGIDVTTPTSGAIAGACGQFYAATGEGVDPDEDDTGLRLFHIGQQELDRGLAGLRKLELGQGQFTFVKKGSASTISPPYSVILAMLGYEMKSKPRPRSKIW